MVFEIVENDTPPKRLRGAMLSFTFICGRTRGGNTPRGTFEKTGGVQTHSWGHLQLFP